MHLLGWDKVVKSKKRDGLGISKSFGFKMLHFGQESSMENMVVRNLDGCLFRMVYKTTFQTFGGDTRSFGQEGSDFASIIRDCFWVKVGAGHLGMINGKGMELERCISKFILLSINSKEG